MPIDFDMNGYCQERFRPVDERKPEAGMAILTKILDDVRDKAPAHTETAI